MNKRLAVIVGVVVLFAVLATIWWSASTRTGDVDESAPSSEAASTQRSEAATAPSSSDVGRAEVAAADRALAPTATSVEELPKRDERARIFGRVVHASRVPIRGADVVATVMLSGQDPASSNAAGEFELRVDTWRLREGFFLMVAARSFEARYVQIAGGSGHEIDAGEIELAPGGVIAGRVLDANGAPVGGACVLIDDLETPYEVLAERRKMDARRLGLPWPIATSAGDGRFELIGLPAGRTRLIAGAEGFLTTFSEIVDLTDTRTRSDLVLVLDPFERDDFVRGVVRDAAGAPVPEALVSVAGDRFRSRRGTDSDGTFSVLLERSEVVDVVVIDMERRRFAEVRGAQPGADLVLSLRAMRVVPFAAHDPSGAPIAEAAMGLELVARGEFWSSVSDPGDDHVLIPPCEFIAHARAPGYAPAELGPLDGETIERIDVMLTPEHSSAELASTPEPDVTPLPILLDVAFQGRITVDGKAPEAAWSIDLGEVRTRDATGPIEHVQLGSDGRFTWSKPAEGAQLLRARIVGGELDGVMFFDTLHVSPAADEWRRDLKTARVRVDGVLGADPLLLVSLDGSGAWAARPLRTVGEFTLFEGEVRIVRMPDRDAQRDPSTWPDIASGRAKHGEALVLRAP